MSNFWRFFPVFNNYPIKSEIIKGFKQKKISLESHLHKLLRLVLVETNYGPRECPNLELDRVFEIILCLESYRAEKEILDHKFNYKKRYKDFLNTIRYALFFVEKSYRNINCQIFKVLTIFW